MESVLKTTVSKMAAAVTEIGCDGIGTVSVFLVPKTVFFCSSEQGILEQTVIGDVFDQFGVDGCAKVRDFGGSPRFCRNRFLSHGTAPVVRPLPCVPSGGSDSVVLQHRTIRA